MPYLCAMGEAARAPYSSNGQLSGEYLKYILLVMRAYCFTVSKIKVYYSIRVAKGTEFCLHLADILTSWAL